MIVAYWIVAGLLALAYLFAGASKLLQPKERLAGRMGWVEDFAAPAIKVIAILEILGAVGVILPPLTGVAPVLAPIAAIGLVLVQAGAIVTHVRRGERTQLLPNVVLLALAIAVAVVGLLVWR